MRFDELGLQTQAPKGGKEGCCALLTTVGHGPKKLRRCGEGQVDLGV